MRKLLRLCFLKDLGMSDFGISEIPNEYSIFPTLLYEDEKTGEEKTGFFPFNGMGENSFIHVHELRNVSEYLNGYCPALFEMRAFLKNYVKMDGKLFTLDEAVSLFVEAVMTAKPITVHAMDGVAFYYKNFEGVDKTILKNQLPREIYAIGSKREMIITKWRNDGEKPERIYNQAFIINLIPGDRKGYLTEILSSSKVIKFDTMFIARRFGSEDEALQYLDENSDMLQDFTYEIVQLPCKAYIPPYWSDFTF